MIILINSAPIWQQTWLLEYYWLYSLCCTLCPCDYSVINVYFLIPWSLPFFLILEGVPSSFGTFDLALESATSTRSLVLSIEQWHLETRTWTLGVLLAIGLLLLPESLSKLCRLDIHVFYIYIIFMYIIISGSTYRLST